MGRLTIYRRVWLLIVLGGLLGGLSGVRPGAAQGVMLDEGHCTTPSGQPVFACWNFAAGASMPAGYADYPEYLPFLKGWDFRINLPHVRLQPARPGVGSAAAMVGVVEGSSNPSVGTMRAYGHTNNSIWIFRGQPSDGQLYYKVMPSRRDVTSSAVENIASLTGAWGRVGPAGSPRLLPEKPAATVLGEGLGKATIYLVARGEDNMLYFTRRVLANTNTASWPEPWTPLGISASWRPTLTTAFGDKLALGWFDYRTARVMVQLYTPATNSWGAAVAVGPAARGAPQLVWDGQALNLFFVANQRLQHTFALRAAPLAFQHQVAVSESVVVRQDSFHAMRFNNRLHVIVQAQGNRGTASGIWYTTTRTSFGLRSVWTAPSHTGLVTNDMAQLVAYQELLFVVGVDSLGRVAYSRKDPNTPGNDQTAGATSDRWINRATPVDPGTPGRFGGVETLAFNNDIYTVASRLDEPQGLYAVNLSRAAMKQLLTGKLRLNLMHGEPGSRALRFPSSDPFAKTGEIPMVGDFNNDRLTDLIKFTQRNQSGVGPAPVYVALSDGGAVGPNTLWHSFFSPAGEIPRVGDFDGDGRDDIVSFVQKKQYYSDGTLLGNAPVWVSLSTGARFHTSRAWHTFFSLAGEIPLVGDFNGDGKDDIITFVQKRQNYSDGTLLGNAPVWVSLSDGTRFTTSRVWHTFFSLAGEVPMVGDFNGDGKDDIASFARKKQYDASGKLIGNAPVWVALSDGTKFTTSRVWHTFFSLAGETPRVADFNLDGRDDIATFLHDASSNDQVRDVYVAHSLGSRFDRSTLWHSDYVAKNQVPFIGNLGGRSLGDITGQPADLDNFYPDIFAFRGDGAVHISTAMGNVPYPSGAPWERYKWFPEKALGAAQFPEWIWEGSKRCVPVGHRFTLLGLGGFGGPNIMGSSVRMGGRAGHVLQELGHSVFANCFRPQPDKNPFNLYKSIFQQPWEQGGFGALAIADVCVPDSGADYYDCRSGENRDEKAEHIFLDLMVKYRIDADAYRARIKSEPDPVYRSQLAAAYAWLKAHWFNGLEFKGGPAINAGLKQDGLQCLPDECGQRFAGAAPAPADYDGDGKDDLAAKTADGRWLIDYAANDFGPTDSVYAAYGDDYAEPVPADYDGDGKDDLSVKSVSSGEWLNDYAADGFGSWNQILSAYGGSEAQPVPADYDGDGKHDLSVKTDGGHWMIDYAADGFGSWNNIYAAYGGDWAVPAPADYDGDGKDDLGVKETHTGRWWIDYAFDGFGGWNIFFDGYGGGDAHPVPADYDGDGRDDLSIKTDGGYWMIDLASDGFGGWNQILSAYGWSDAHPVPADYDGDGKDDLSVKTDGGEWLIDYAADGFGAWNRMLN